MRSAFAIAILLLPVISMAAEIKPENAWHYCQKASDCVLAESVCGPIA